MNIDWYGSAEYNGYGIVNYFLVNTLREQGHKIRFTSLDGNSLAIESDTRIPSNVKTVCFNPSNQYYDVKQIAWDGIPAPIDLVRKANYCKELWTPSLFSKQAFLYGGIVRSCTVIPHGITPDIFNPDVAPMFDKKDNFIFLSIFYYHARKNAINMILGFENEFNKDENVKLLIHTTPKSREYLKEFITTKNVYFTEKYPLTFEEIASLYTSVDIFFLPTLGEAFCLPCLEAGACGIPSIVTYFGGQIEYLGNDAFYLPIDRFEYMKEWKTTMARMDIIRCKAILRTVVDYPEAIRRLGKRLSKRIRNEYTWDKICNNIVERLELL